MNPGKIEEISRRIRTVQQMDTSLIRAVRLGDKNTMLTLLNPNNVDSQDEFGESVLIITITLGYVDIVRILLNYHADPTLMDDHGFNAIDFAIYANNKEIIDILKDHEVRVINPDQLNLVVTQAIRGGNILTLLRLRDHLTHSMDYRDSQGLTFLILAIIFGYLDIVKFLIEFGFDPNIPDNSGNNAFFHAITCQNIDIMKYLIDQWVNVNEKNPDGNTALILASKRGLYEVVQILLQKKANPDLIDNLGKTALMHTILNGSLFFPGASLDNIYTTAKLLCDYHANVNLQDLEGNKILQYALEKNSSLFVELLLEYGADPNSIDICLILDRLNYRVNTLECLKLLLFFGLNREKYYKPDNKDSILFTRAEVALGLLGLGIVLDDVIRVFMKEYYPIL